MKTIKQLEKKIREMEQVFDKILYSKGIKKRAAEVLKKGVNIKQEKALLKQTKEICKMIERVLNEKDIKEAIELGDVAGNVAKDIKHDLLTNIKGK